MYKKIDFELAIDEESTLDLEEVKEFFGNAEGTKTEWQNLNAGKPF